MATFLNRQNKNVLLLLAAEFDTEVSADDKKVPIIQAILNASDYDEQIAKDMLEGIIEEREKLAEQEKLDKIAEQERLDRLKREEQESLEREKDRQLELEKVRLQYSVDTSSLASTVSVTAENKDKKVSLKDLVPKFDPKSIDITLFFMIFESQASKENLEESKYVSQLIPLLPVDVAEIIVKEPVEKRDDYQHIKSVLLKRFRLGAGTLRTKFETHQRKAGALWSELVYELRGYLEYWLETVEVNDFESLKELILTEQVKRRVPFAIKDKFLDEWDEIKKASYLAEKCDKYESVRGNVRKSDNKIWNNKPYFRDRNGQDSARSKGEQAVKSGGADNRDNVRRNSWNKDKFDRKRPIICFQCNQAGHIRPDCPDLKRKGSVDIVSHLNVDVSLGECFTQYFKKAEINGIERNYLRDTGSGIDLCDRSWIDNEDLIGGVTWIKQPLDNECKCLPLARVTIKGDFGRVVTKAAVIPIELEQGYYLLGNKTAELIEKSKGNSVSVKAVITRSQEREHEREISAVQVESKSGSEAGDLEEVEFREEEKGIVIPERLEMESGLVKVSAEKFKEEQKNCPSLEELWEKSKNSNDNEFCVREGKLLQVSQTRSGDEKVQLGVSENYGREVLALCHEQVSGQLGATKSKETVLRCSSSPNDYHHIEKHVQIFDNQNVDSNWHRFKVPLSLISTISKCFSKINLNAIGSIQTSSKKNKYFIASIRPASSLPDAISVGNMISTSIINVVDVNTRKYPNLTMKIGCRYFENPNRDGFLNVIGFEFSHTGLENPVECTTVVRKVDCVDFGGPRNLKDGQTDWINSLNEMKLLKVKKYCFMGGKSCYTIFHIDFGSTSFWYLILRWKKLVKERKHDTEDCLADKETEGRRMFWGKEKFNRDRFEERFDDEMKAEGFNLKCLREQSFVKPVLVKDKDSQRMRMSSANFTVNEIRKRVGRRRVLGGFELFAWPYIDDILLFLLTWECRMKDIPEIRKPLLQVGLTVKPTKCDFERDSVSFLGHEILELFTAVREATKEITNNPYQDAPVINNNEILPSMNSCQQFEVLYIGRIKVSGKRPPPSFVDDAVEKFRIYEAEKARNFKNGLTNCKKSCSNGVYNVSSLPQSKSAENGFDSCANVTKCNSSHTNNTNDEKLDAFNHICCDNSSDSFLQSPLTPICHSDPLQAFSSLKQSTNSPDQDVTFHPKKGIPSNLMPPSSLITHTQSLDVPARASIVHDLRENDLSVMLRDRVRSCSGDIPRTKQSSLPAYRPRCGSGGSTELTRPRAFTSPNPTRNQQNRVMLFIIGPRNIFLLSMDKKQILLNKTFNDIAHCSQGVKHLEHFGFISRETTVTGANCYAGYIFRCQTERVVDEIMSTLKQAFKEAHHSYQSVKNPQVPNIVVCDECPMNWFHLLCSDLEGLTAKETHLKILQKLGTLPDCDKEEIMVKFQKSDFSDVQEQNEILMMLLREYCEQKQIKHSHNLSRTNGKNEVIKEKVSRLDSFREKAKKTVSNSFESFLKLTNRDEGRDASSTSENNLKPFQVVESENEKNNQKDLDTHSYRESSYSEDLSSLRLSPLLTRPRSSTFSSPREKLNKKAKLQHETPKKTPIINMFMKSRNENRSQTPAIEKSPRGAWRQAIFHRVQTPVNQKLGRGKLDSCSSSDDETKERTRTRKSKEELRALWKKAIIEQILLIRMEKENKKLQDNQDAVSYKRMKLNYKEITPCLKASVLKWEGMLDSVQRTNIDRATLTDMVKSGIPRHKRGDIWEFLAEYNKSEWNNGGISDHDTSVPYDELLKQLTSHQHSILIDIGRTFPNHPFYSQSLGSGQLSLFNLLKAYSLMDKEVGYCQGLSFVAGILLLHMPEERAFYLLKYLMFDLGLRRQYKTDMVAFQIQMYQLSRLIHDNYPDLYDHLEKFDIAPTLYAAPWFLTLFASQFPVGFVSRLFDLIFLNGLDVVFKVSLMLLGNYKHEILACDSFESIMDYLKTVLPSIDVLQMEIIFNQVFNLDISRQLHAYEVEYHVLLEEMIHSPSQSNPELENLQIANKNLKAQNMELMDQLQVAYSRIHSLEASEASLKSSVRRLESRVSNLEDEKEALQHSLRIMKNRLERLEAARIEDDILFEEDEHTPSFKTVYNLAGSEKEEDERFKKLIRKISQSNKGDTLEEEDDATESVFERNKGPADSEL